MDGVVGLIVDCASGASDELIPKEVHFNFASPELTTREAIKVKEKDKKAALDKEAQVQKSEEEEAETTQKPPEETKVVTKKEYEEYQRYLSEKEDSNSQDSQTEK